MKFALIFALFLSSTAFAIGHDIGNGEGFDPCNPDGSTRQWINFELSQMDVYVRAGGLLDEDMMIRREWLILVKSSSKPSKSGSGTGSGTGSGSGSGSAPSDDDCRFQQRASFQQLIERANKAPVFTDI